MACRADVARKSIGRHTLARVRSQCVDKTVAADTPDHLRPSLSSSQHHITYNIHSLHTRAGCQQAAQHERPAGAQVCQGARTAAQHRAATPAK